MTEGVTKQLDLFLRILLIERYILYRNNIASGLWRSCLTQRYCSNLEPSHCLKVQDKKEFCKICVLKMATDTNIEIEYSRRSMNIQDNM